MNDLSKIQQIIEGLLLAAGKALTLEQITAIFTEDECPESSEIKEALDAIEASCEGRGFELKKVASGYRFQVRQEIGEWVGRLWDEKPQKYSRALLETLSIIAYRQPLTRGDIEKIRGVAVNTQIVRTLHDREWIRVVGHRDVPGRPAMYATTRQFLDYFNLENLDQLPALAEIRDMDEVKKEMNKELSLDQVLSESRVLEMPQGEESEQGYQILDDEDEAVVAWATQPLSAILGEDKPADDQDKVADEPGENAAHEAKEQLAEVNDETASDLAQADDADISALDADENDNDISRSDS